MTYLTKSMNDSHRKSNLKQIAKNRENFGEIGFIEHLHKMKPGKTIPQRRGDNAAKGLKSALKAKSCKECKAKFTPSRPLQVVCSYPCSIKYGRKLIEKQETIEWKVKKENLKTLTDYENILQPLVNKLARLIDYGQPCISCLKPPRKEQGGHRHSTGANKTLTFNLHNIFRQCFYCNHELSGNPTEFDNGLQAVFGNDYYEYVRYQIIREYPEIHWSKDELKEYTIRARKILKTHVPIMLSAKERIEMRTKINQLIGIYK